MSGTLPRTLQQIHKRSLDRRGRPVKSLRLPHWPKEEPCPNEALQRVIDETRRRIAGCFENEARRMPARYRRATPPQKGPTGEQR